MTSSKAVLWQNVAALMQHKFGKENLTGFAHWVGTAVANIQRIRAQDTSVGLDIIDKIAQKAHLEPWQLLLPDLDVTDPPLRPQQQEQMRVLLANVRSSTAALSGILHLEGNTDLDRLPEPPPPKKR